MRIYGYDTSSTITVTRNISTPCPFIKASLKLSGRVSLGLLLVVSEIRNLFSNHKKFSTWLLVIRSLPPGKLEYADPTPLPDAFSQLDYTDGQLNLQQLRLMHNWYDQTASTMALDDSEVRGALWSKAVPTLAIDNPFLMHGLLAISAAHVAYSRAEMRDSYLSVARKHRELGHRSLQTLDAPKSSTQAHCLQEATAAFILMNTVLSLALAGRTGHAERDLNTFIDWLIFLRTSLELAHRFYEQSLHYGESRISALIRHSEDGPTELSALDKGVIASLDLLDARNRASDTTSPVDIEHISGAIAKIKLWIRLVSLRPQTALFISTCTTDLSDDFFRLAKEGNPVSLIAMAHFLVPMCHAPRKWFWGDWFDAAIAAIVQVLPIDQWHENLGWVLEQVDISRFSFK